MGTIPAAFRATAASVAPDLVAPDSRATMPAPRREVRSTPYGGSAVLPPGRSYKAHWEVLDCVLCLLTARAIPHMGPVWGRGFCPGSRRPRARVPVVVWAWDLVVIRLLCRGLPAPARRQFFALRFVTVCH